MKREVSLKGLRASAGGGKNVHDRCHDFLALVRDRSVLPRHVVRRLVEPVFRLKGNSIDLQNFQHVGPTEVRGVVRRCVALDVKPRRHILSVGARQENAEISRR